MDNLTENVREKLQAATLNYQQKRFAEAEALYREVITLDDRCAEAFRLLGVLLTSWERYDEAIAALKRAVELKPDQAVTYLNLGNLYRIINQVNYAKNYFLKSLEFDCKSPKSYYYLGLLCRSQGEKEQAIYYYQQAIAFDPKAFDAFNNLGLIYKEQGELELALDCYQQAIKINPNVPEILNNLANIYQIRKQWQQAKSHYERAIAIRHDYVEALNNLGSVYQEEENFFAAIELYQRAIEIDQEYFGAYNNLAIAYQKTCELDLALAICQKALTFYPESHEIYLNMALIYQTWQQWEEAIQYYRQSLTFKPDFPQARNNLGLLLLLLGKMPEGWQLSESRFDSDTYQKNKPKIPMWDGSELNGKSIVIWNEQGLGDAIQFVRYAAMVKAKGGEVTLRVHPYLMPLFQECLADHFNIIGQNQGNIYHYDEQISIMSLPLAFNTDLSSIPDTCPYIFPPAKLRQHCLLEPTENLRVGIVWASHIKNKGLYEKKSCTAADFMSLLEIPGVNFYSLQVGIDASQIEPYLEQERVIDCSELLKDFVDTATIVHQLDLVISIDTAVAHLAGAMGKPVWLLLPHVADWRWLLDREDSPWYPTMRLFRQSSSGDWQEIFGRVKQALQHWVTDSQAIATWQQARPVIDYAAILAQTDDCAESVTQIHHDRPQVQTTPPFPTTETAASGAIAQQLQQGITAHQAGQLRRAKRLYEAVLSLDPDCVEAWRLLGIIATTNQNYDQALERFQQALRINPNHAATYINLGSLYKNQEQWQRAIAMYQKAIELEPKQGNAYNHLGNLYKEIHQFRAARTAYETAIHLNPDNALFRSNFALFLLLRGHLKRGFAEYEYRFKTTILSLYKPKNPMWDGQTDLKGKTLVLWNEQGLGDILQFVRYAYLLKAQGVTVHLCVPSALIKLFQECLLEQFEVFGEDPQAIEAAAYQTSMMSLPHYFGTELSSIPYPTAYLKAPLNPSPQCLLPPTDHFKIGIVWKSKRDNPKLYEKKSCDINFFIRLLELPNVALYSLQVGVDAEDIQPYLGDRRVTDLTPLINDFYDTASLIAQLDLVITVDTAVAHLAGAMGKPTWVLLPYTPDWRWLLDRQDSPWYDSVKLFRQNAVDQWESVWSQVRQELYSHLELRPDTQQDFSFQKHSVDDPSIQFSFQKHFFVTSPADILISSNQTITEPQPIPSLNELLQQAIKHHQADDLAIARKLYQQILAQDPHHIEALRLLALAVHKLGRSTRAIELLEKAINLASENALLYQHLGNIYRENGQLQKAIPAYQQVLRLKGDTPETAIIYNDIALIYQGQRRWQQAIAAYEKAIALKPDLTAAHNNLGMVYQEINQSSKAIQCYETAIQLNPNIAEVYNNLGNVYQSKKQWEQAATLYQQAIALKPHYPEAHNNLGAVCYNQKKYADGLTYCQKAIELRPNYADPYNNLGMIHRELKQVDQAIAYHKKALELNPHKAEHHGNIALVLLMKGRFKRGFQESEYRFDTKEYQFAKPKTPMWDGSDLNGQTIAIWNEQGIGDAIQFIRYIPQIIAKGGKPTALISKSLVSLFQDCLQVEITAKERHEADIYQDFDCHASIMSLPRILGTTLTTIPNQTPYIFPPQPLRENCILPETSRYKIGIVWASNRGTKIYEKKSCPIALFINSLLVFDNVQLYSLQVGEDAPDLAPYTHHEQVTDLSPLLQDFADTATVISQLDLVISIDTAVAHLAAAMGKPTWVLLPFAPDWRWFPERQDSPWYPAARLFRQPNLGDWSSVLAAVQTQLTQVLDGANPLFTLTDSGVLESLLVTGSVPPKVTQLFTQQQNQQQGKLQQTIASYQQALTTNPNAFDIWNNLGLLYVEQQQYDAAINCYEKSLAIQPTTPEVYNNLGNVYKALEDYEQAIALYQKALALRPNYPEAHNNLGAVCCKQENYQAAIACLQTARQLRSDYWEPLTNLGVAYQQLKNYPAAIDAYRQAIAIQPQTAFIHNDLGKVYEEQEQWETAIECYQQAIALKPDYADAQINLGNVYQELGQIKQQRYYFENALKHYFDALAYIDTEEKKPYHNIGVAYQELKQFDQALEYFKKALAIEPDSALAHGNLGLVKLLLGDLIGGGKECEWRFEKGKYAKSKPKTPMWDGQAFLAGKSIVLWNEQGIGDAIHFVRYASQLKAQGATVVISVHPLLIELFSSCLADQFEIINENDCDIYRYDFHASILNLPLILQTTLETIPNTIPYIFAPAQIPEKCLLPPSKNHKIGIAWASNINAKIYHKKTATADYFMDLLRFENIELYSLQVGIDAPQIEPWRSHPRVHDFSQTLNHFDDTAAVIAQLDLVISVDTAVAHLAAAMGKPTWIVLPYVPDYRWFLDRSDSPWYPTMRLFRQPDIGDWTSVFQAIAQQLQTRLETAEPNFFP